MEVGFITQNTCMLYLELDIVSVLLDLHTLGVLPAGFQQEVLDLLDFPRHLLQN